MYLYHEVPYSSPVLPLWGASLYSSPATPLRCFKGFEVSPDRCYLILQALDGAVLLTPCLGEGFKQPEHLGSKASTS